MFLLNGQNIAITRGDTLRLKLEIINEESGELYIPSDGDIVEFGVKAKYAEEECLIKKVIPNDTLILHIAPEDTKPLNFGSYVYDCQVTFANGDVKTFISKKKFKITEEVV